MTDIILSSFLSLFALFGKEENVDESRAHEMLVNYLRHHFGIRNIDIYLDYYTDIREAYEINERYLLEPTWSDTFTGRGNASAPTDGVL